MLGHSPVAGLRDGQQIRICHFGGNEDAILPSPTSSQSKRRRSVVTKSPINSDRMAAVLSPTTSVFSPLPVIQEGSEEWQDMRHKLSKRHVPDWAVALLPRDIGVSERGIPKSGTEGVNWRVSGRRVGWAGRWKSEKMFCTLNDMSHVEAINAAAEWRIRHFEANSTITSMGADPNVSQQTEDESDDISPVERGRKVTESCTDSRPSGESHSGCCECDISGILRERSLVRGVALCKGSWKARWRDATGRQRMRTFGPTFADREAAEKFIVTERETVLQERKLMRDVKTDDTTERSGSTPLPVASTTGDGFLPSIEASTSIVGFPSPKFETRCDPQKGDNEGWNQDVLASLISNCNEVNR